MQHRSRTNPVNYTKPKPEPKPEPKPKPKPYSKPFRTCALSSFIRRRYKDGMGPDELCDVAARCLLAAMARDCLSGVDAVVHVITRAGLTTRVLKCPSD